ncbi:NADH-quinone oxidoreductase subunit N [Actinomarinicola tropica]|uniref:NADH-quinone oxidoreductase subunit N n=1 Tax=Actinomarinicola tropica TaxID=2789776 RepID=A0A5Q2RDR0_9ACTN|nr:NADH-quinone oxidoreductase subunit N [Actinomarinicola tropica]QGG93824.1 NADH-quinone oxidoreductase subunit NuoN [Actinomarinicola tropica]
MDPTALLTVAFERPPIDWHAVAPELTLLGVGALLTLLDVVLLERGRKYMPALAGIGVLVTLVPILTLAVDGTNRTMFGGAFVVDEFALLFKALILVSGYVVILLSTNYVAEGDYWESEYYGLLLSSMMGMVLIASARDLITLFVALELLSIPAYLLAGWRKRALEGNEAGMKYFLMGVFASAIMLYGMSLLYGVAGDTRLSAIGEAVHGSESVPLITLGVVFTLIGFAFKVSAVPFHTWAPDVYQGAPTPITGFLAVASKTSGFIALLQLVFVAFPDRDDVYQPLFWVLALLTMTVGNLVALRQTNVVRLFAYSGVAQAGYILCGLAVAGDVGDQALQAIATYLVIYAAMNLGVFAIIIAVARKTRSGDIASYGGLFEYAPGLAVSMVVFLFALAGIPPLAGWYAKFAIFKVTVEANSWIGYSLAVAVAINSVIALFYYANIARQMFMNPVPDGDTTRIRVPFSLVAALVITVAATVALGVYPRAVTHLTEVSLLAGAG